MYALIVAGGSGSRLWPLSRKSQPKQLLKFINNQTLLQNTYGRLRKVFSANEIFVATTAQYAPSIKKQLPQIPDSHFSLETATKDRGPAIGLAALLMSHFNPNAIFVTSWSDHYIKDEKAYFAALKTAEKFLKNNPEYFVTIGVKPSHPHTGLGYIEVGNPVSPSPLARGDASSAAERQRGRTNGVYQVDSFTEKPERSQAEIFLKNNKHLWNTGYFVCRADTLLDLYKQHLPKIYSLLMKIKPALGTKNQQLITNRYYHQMPQADIEKGLVEKLSKIAVVPAKFDWVDVGSWKVIKETIQPSSKDLIAGNVLDLNSTDSLIYNFEDKLVAVVGLKDAIIINTKDALLITDKAHSEQVKQLVETLKKNKRLKKYL